MANGSAGTRASGTRTATLVVAASDASAQSKRNADYVCDGVADDVEIQAAHDVLPNYGRLVCLEGRYNLANPIVWTKSLTTFDCYGVLRSTGTSVIELGNLVAVLDKATMFINQIDGIDRSSHGIVHVWAQFCTIKVSEILNCDSGIYFPQNGQDRGEAYFHYGRIYECNYGVSSETPGIHNDLMLGFQFHGGMISHCHTCGFYAQGQFGEGYIQGVIDCVDYPGINDFVDVGTIGRWVLSTKWIRRNLTFFKPSDCAIGLRGGWIGNSVWLPKYSQTGFDKKEHDYTNWLSSVLGTGVVTKGVDSCLIYTGVGLNATANLYKLLYTRSFNSINLDSTDEILLMCTIEPTGDVANALWYFKVDDDETPADPNSKAFGFKMENTTLFGIVHSGGALFTTNLGTILAGGPHNLFCRFVSGTRIQWFVGDTLVGEDTTVAHLPTGAIANPKASFCVTNGATAANKALYGESIEVEILGQG